MIGEIEVTALGELLIDFTPAGSSETGNLLFERNPGGAPANVLAALAKLGKKTAFIGKVGQDEFGVFLRQVLELHGIDTGGLMASREYPTTLAFVHLHEDGDRSFSFYRKHGADQMLSAEEVDYERIASSRLFHFGSVSLTANPAAAATLRAAEFAKQQGITVSFDVNLRVPLWDSLERARKIILEALKHTDILKVSEEELQFLTDTDDLDKGSALLYTRFGIKLIFVTMGKAGSFFRKAELTGSVPAFPVKAVDTTGAGDGFFGGVLYRLLESEDQTEALSVEQLTEALRFGNAVGALTTTKRGGISALPSMEEISAFLNS